MTDAFFIAEIITRPTEPFPHPTASFSLRVALVLREIEGFEYDEISAAPLSSWQTPVLARSSVCRFQSGWSTVSGQLCRRRCAD